MLQKNNLFKKFISVALIAAMVVCSLFTMSATAVYNEFNVTEDDIIAAIAKKLGVSVEDIKVETMSAAESDSSKHTEKSDIIICSETGKKCIISSKINLRLTMEFIGEE